MQKHATTERDDVLMHVQSSRGNKMSMRTGAIGAVALLMSSGSSSQEEGRGEPARARAACADSTTDNRYLDLAVGGSSAGRPIACVRAPEPAPGLALATLRTPSGITIGVGRGGQIYSIRLSEIAGDLIPLQPRNSRFVDLVLQTVATNQALRNASPRVQLQAARKRGVGKTAGIDANNLAAWHYHQAGAYSRGQLANMPPRYSPLLADRVDARDGTIETLNLALQAHPVSAIGERFLAYMRLDYIGDDSFRLTQAWIDQRQPSSGEGGGLDYFNFPWLALNRTLLPTLVGEVSGQAIDLTDAAWPSNAGGVSPGPRWIGAFPDANRRGMALVLPSTPGTVLRAGGLRQEAVAPRGEGSVTQSLFIVENALRGQTLRRGGGIVATSFLVFGNRATVATRARALSAMTSVRPFRLAITPPATATPLCGDRALTACPSSAARRWRVHTKLCTDCQALYELQNGSGIRYDTNPYYGSTPSTYLARPAYRINRIVGWVPTTR